MYQDLMRPYGVGVYILSVCTIKYLNNSVGIAGIGMKYLEPRVFYNSLKYYIIRTDLYQYIEFVCTKIIFYSVNEIGCYFYPSAKTNPLCHINFKHMKYSLVHSQTVPYPKVLR